jgi:Leucine-rich repeat (LRR) protein
MHFSSTVTLKKLFLDRNRISSLPDWVSQLDNIEELCASDNHLFQQALTEKFGTTCKKVKVLDLGGNFMSSLPDSFGCLENLEKLSLGSVIDELERRNFQNGNWISYLPYSFCDLIDQC